MMKCELETVRQKFPKQHFLLLLVIQINSFNGLRIDIVLISCHPSRPVCNLPGIELVTHHDQVPHGHIARVKVSAICSILNVGAGVLDWLDCSHLKYGRCGRCGLSERRRRQNDQEHRKNRSVDERCAEFPSNAKTCGHLVTTPFMNRTFNQR